MPISTRHRWRVGLGLLRAGLALPLWAAAHWCALACIYGGFFLPEYVSAPRRWLLPVAWAAALYVGVRVAAGGGFPFAWWRAMPFTWIAWVLVAEGAAVEGNVFYSLWAALWVSSAFLTGYQQATHPWRCAAT